MIRHSYTPPYAPSNYDEHMCLRPPLILWLAAVYFSRALMLPVAIGIGHAAGVNVDAMTWLRAYWSVDELLPAFVAIPVLLAMCRRAPAASRLVRWVWKRGRNFLAVSACLDIAMRMIPHIRRAEFDEETLLALLICGIDAYFLLYVLVARRVRDTFLDFPSPLARR